MHMKNEAISAFDTFLSLSVHSLVVYVGAHGFDPHKARTAHHGSPDRCESMPQFTNAERICSNLLTFMYCATFAGGKGGRVAELECLLSLNRMLCCPRSLMNGFAMRRVKYINNSGCDIVPRFPSTLNPERRRYYRHRCLDYCQNLALSRSLQTVGSG